MKTSIKKIMVFMLVSALMVCAITYMSSAANNEYKTVSAEEYQDNAELFTELIEEQTTAAEKAVQVTEPAVGNAETTAEPETTEQQTEEPETFAAVEEITETIIPKSAFVEQYYECPADLRAYMAQNPEVYAYIYIPGTGISYPVLQSRKSDLFYLDNDWQGNADRDGAIFSQSHNNTYFTDPVTVLYGHNTGKGNMFSQLHNFKDERFFEENDLVIIYTADRTMVYRIFSAFTFDDRHIMNSYDFTDKGDLNEYQQILQNPSDSTGNTRSAGLDSNSQILTLSTCGESHRGCSTRYLVSAVLVDTVNA